MFLILKKPLNRQGANITKFFKKKPRAAYYANPWLVYLGVLFALAVLE